MAATAQRQAARVGIFTGAGTSHSWIWLADILERGGHRRVVCVDEDDVRRGALRSCDVLFISGGDTFAMAEGLGDAGAREIDEFVIAGGTYIGACAGTYLVLHSSLAPLSSFNFVRARITNLVKTLPAARQASEKFCTEYGCRYIYHPVREDVRVRPAAGIWTGHQQVIAPLYGGPGMLASEDIEVLATYAGFTGATEYLVDEPLARETLVGRVAAARKARGGGYYYLFGPHFEHPGYCEANGILLGIIDRARRREFGMCPGGVRGRCGARANRAQVRQFVSRISTARIMALALERSPAQWTVGRKVYDAQRFRVFTEALWQRARHLLRIDAAALTEEDLARLLGESAAVIDRLRILRSCAGDSCAGSRHAEELVAHLRKLTALFMTRFFQLGEDGLFDDERRRACICTLKLPQPSTP